jgi:predicted pyridoxine 5'-phosphate oxidase superfamily flavin-nucleotide-binding protein
VAKAFVGSNPTPRTNQSAFFENNLKRHIIGHLNYVEGATVKSTKNKGVAEVTYMKIPENVKESLNRSLKARRVVFATASKDGMPNAVPVGIIRFPDDETVLVVDNYFLKTRANLEKNTQAALTFWDMVEKDGKLVNNDGYQLKGKIRIENSGPLYEKVKAEVKAIRAEFPAKAIVLLKVEEIFDVKAGPNAGKKL